MTRIVCEAGIGISGNFSDNVTANRDEAKMQIMEG